MQRQWYEDFFHGLIVEMWARAAGDEMTAPEIPLLQSELRLPPGGRVLDLPCGHGRHAVALARLGYRVTGADISEECLALAREAAAAAGVEICLRQLDMRRLDERAAYDGAICLGNSFTYLDDADLRDFVQRLAAALVPGGRLMVHTGFVAESMLPKLPEDGDYTTDDVHLHAARTYQIAAGRLAVTYTVRRGAEEVVRSMTGGVYTVAEISRMLAAAGLAVEALYGSTDRKPYAVGDQQLWLVARRE
jgi:SAM-dependent methyltransferase